ncbi:N-methyl-L-tryptophan oxidase [Paenibacillus sp. 481]|uniref:N-methyl-L-tryptophan oxidase n=1 Tax=Paenibacillus sp. 481 TaxID=2835869 RepID=UPI001E5147DA|nr:N-methyl-L-tryptophan oxidase [Paenibacillus sp. 481]UHA75274.1 N-methyl-L-tryptophan oxidase [Paenibacillus sp. 481]
MDIKYDVIVIGAGSFGASAGAHLARAGAKVLLLDAYYPPHERGSHHGATRIFRAGYTMGSAYVELAKLARERWLELERDAEQILGGYCQGSLFLPTGTISIGARNNDALAKKEAGCLQHEIPYQRWDQYETERLYPVLSLPKDSEVLFEPWGGVLLSEQIIKAYIQLAIRAGAQFLPYHPVQQINSSRSGVQIVSGNKRFEAGRVLVTAGVYLPQLLPALQLPIQAARRVFAWYEDQKGLHDAAQFPSFIVHEHEGSEYYGIPSLQGSGLKVGHHQRGQSWGLDQPVAPFGTYPSDEGELHAFVKRMFPRVGECSGGAACLYELTPNEHFMIDRHPTEERIWFAGGGSGHGFKFASAIGPLLGEWLLQGTPPKQLRPFHLAAAL